MSSYISDILSSVSMNRNSKKPVHGSTNSYLKQDGDLDAEFDLKLKNWVRHILPSKTEHNINFKNNFNNYRNIATPVITNKSFPQHVGLPVGAYLSYNISTGRGNGPEIFTHDMQKVSSQNPVIDNLSIKPRQNIMDTLQSWSRSTAGNLYKYSPINFTATQAEKGGPMRGLLSGVFSYGTAGALLGLLRYLYKSRKDPYYNESLLGNILKGGIIGSTLGGIHGYSVGNYRNTKLKNIDIFNKKI